MQKCTGEDDEINVSRFSKRRLQSDEGLNVNVLIFTCSRAKASAGGSESELVASRLALHATSRLLTTIHLITTTKHGARKEWKSRIHRQHPLRYACALVHDTRQMLTEIQVSAKNKSSTRLEESAR